MNPITLTIILFLILIFIPGVIPVSPSYTKIAIIIVMFFYPIYSFYPQRNISKGKLLFTLRQGRSWMALSIISKIILSLISLFFIIVAIRFVWKGVNVGIVGWLFQISAIIFFGSAAVIGKTKLIFTEKGITAHDMGIRWDRIKGHRWAFTKGDKIYALVIYLQYFGFKIPITIRGVHPDFDIREKIDRIFEEKIQKQ